MWFRQIRLQDWGVAGLHMPQARETAAEGYPNLVPGDGFCLKLIRDAHSSSKIVKYSTTDFILLTLTMGVPTIL